MVKSILWLGAAAAASLICAPAIAQDEMFAPTGAGPSCADACQGAGPQPNSRAGYSDQAYSEGAQGESAYRSSTTQYSSGDGSMMESRAGYAASRTQSSDYLAYEARYFASRRSQGVMHHTTDGAGFLNWNGKTTDFVSDGDQAYGAPPPPEADAGGPACPGGGGIRVLSCQYIPFTPPEAEQPLAIDDEDFAYEGGAGPIGVSGGGGGGGGGSMIETGSGQAFANAFSRASASASASASISISGHFGGHGGGHGGYGGGGYHGGGGHMGGGCGCGGSGGSSWGGGGWGGGHGHGHK